MAIHPGAAIFSPEARRAVADGPPFDRQTTDGQFVRADGCCLVGALIREQWPNAFTSNAILPNITTVISLLLEYGMITEPIGLPEWAIVSEVNDLMERNDEGYYATPEVLRRDLLGILAARIPQQPAAAAGEGR